MTDITLIFPDQLFLNHPGIAVHRPVYLAEEFLFFKVQPFHKQRLVLLKSALSRYAALLRQRGYAVTYIPSKQLPSRGSLGEFMGKQGIKRIHMAEFADEWLYQDLMAAAARYGWDMHFYPSPGFICAHQELKTFFADKTRYSMAQFYTWQRRSQNILMSGPRPVGGKYSFDAHNRKKIPKGLCIPPTFFPPHGPHTDKILAEVESEFPEAIGAAAPFLYPTTHDEARQALAVFLKDKFAFFGDYQDALQKEASFLFHSVLSPLLNIGLLTPQEVIEAALEHAQKQAIPLNSLEGFLRQILGWREFIRAAYLLKGSDQRTRNFLQHDHQIPRPFREGNTGIPPLDAVIKRVWSTGYCSHIERLMVLGNFLLLTETAPRAIYEWFMGNFVDAYDWVMVPNVYGMSQYADGGITMTKPYLSSSHYLLKMSNYPGGEWAEIWDGLFWRFLRKHPALFSSNPRTLNLMHVLSKNQAKIAPKIDRAELWLANYRRA